MEVHIAEQTRLFAVFIALGVVSGWAYDIVRAFVGTVRPGKIVKFILDFLYCGVCMCAVIYFSFMFAGGTLKIYSLVGTILGAAL